MPNFVRHDPSVCLRDGNRELLSLSSTEVYGYFQSECMVGKLVKITKPIPASQAAWKNYLLGSVRHLRFSSKVSAAHIFTLPKSWPSILVKVSNQRIILASFCLHG